MPGPFPVPPIFQGKSPGDEVDWFEGSWTSDCYVEQRELEEEFRHANFSDAAK